MFALSCPRTPRFGLLSCSALLVLSAAASAGCAAAERCRFEVPVVQEPAPPPFTAEQIRGAMRVGRKDRTLYTGDRIPPYFADAEVLAVKDERYAIRVDGDSYVPVGWGHENDATIRERLPAPETWRDVMALRDFDRARTSILEQPCETPLGRLDCVIYSYAGPRSGPEITVRNFYAKSLPGPPIVRSISVCRKLVWFSAIVRHVDGS